MLLSQFITGHRDVGKLVWEVTVQVQIAAVVASLVTSVLLVTCEERTQRFTMNIALTKVKAVITIPLKYSHLCFISCALPLSAAVKRCVKAMYGNFLAIHGSLQRIVSLSSCYVQPFPHKWMGFKWLQKHVDSDLSRN